MSDYQQSHCNFKTGMLTELLMLPQLWFLSQPKILTAVFCFNSHLLAILVEFGGSRHIPYQSSIQVPLQPCALLLLWGTHSRQGPMMFPKVKDWRSEGSNALKACSLPSQTRSSPERSATGTFASLGEAERLLIPGLGRDAMAGEVLRVAYRASGGRFFPGELQSHARCSMCSGKSSRVQQVPVFCVPLL